MAGPLARVRDFLEMIKFSHTVFALPFALAAAAMAAVGRATPASVWIWIVVAVASARTAAMSANRILDRDFDRTNPRTAARHLPSGRMSLRFAIVAAIIAAAIFFMAAWRLNPLALMLSPFVLAWLIGYSLAKRFTALSHLWLGTALALAPIGAWIAVRGSILDDPVPPLMLAAAVTLWTAGFDILYSCADRDHDLREKLHSIPARLGIARAFVVARALHALVIVLLLALPAIVPGLGVITAVAAGAVAILLMIEHIVVSPTDLSRLNLAFFTLNGAVSILLGGAIALDASYAT